MHGDVREKAGVLLAGLAASCLVRGGMPHHYARTAPLRGPRLAHQSAQPIRIYGRRAISPVFSTPRACTTCTARTAAPLALQALHPLPALADPVLYSKSKALEAELQAILEERGATLRALDASPKVRFGWGQLGAQRCCPAAGGGDGGARQGVGWLAAGEGMEVGGRKAAACCLRV